MTEAFSGPHLWVLLASLLYLAAVIASVVRVLRMQELSVFAKLVWSAAIIAVPLGGLIVFWSAHWPKREDSAPADL